MQSRIQSCTPIALSLAILILFSNSLGCAFGEVYWDDPLKREYSLSETQKRYTALVRFGDYNQAAKFVDPDKVLEFIKAFPGSDDLVLTDHSSSKIAFTGEKDDRKTAEVIVTYAAYHTQSLVVFDVIETQEWYRDGSGNDWRVRPHFQGLERFAAANLSRPWKWGRTRQSLPEPSRYHSWVSTTSKTTRDWVW